MKREIIVNSSIVETRVAVLEDGILVELLIDDSKNKSIAGNIYKGRVLKILPGMQAAFVDLGLAKDAFLYVRDIFEDVEEYEQICSELNAVNSRLSRFGAEPLAMPEPLPTTDLGDLIIGCIRELRSQGKL